MKIDNGVYDPEYQDLQDTQQAQVAALRGFYIDERPLVVSELEEVIFPEEERSEIAVTDNNLPELCAWLRKATTWLAFKPAVVENERGLLLVF